MQPFIDAGIEEYADVFLDLYEELDDLRNIKKEIQSNIESLPGELRKLAKSIFQMD